MATQTVLVVEDDTNLREAYATVLKAEGYDAQTAPDGAAGLKLANELRPDVILLDMLMPNLNGLEFLKEYNTSRHNDTKIIVFSNMSVPSDVKDAMSLGATKYLTKSSFTPKELVEIIKDVEKVGK